MRALKAYSSIVKKTLRGKGKKFASQPNFALFNYDPQDKGDGVFSGPANESSESSYKKEAPSPNSKKVSKPSEDALIKNVTFENFDKNNNKTKFEDHSEKKMISLDFREVVTTSLGKREYYYRYYEDASPNNQFSTQPVENSERFYYQVLDVIYTGEEAPDAIKNKTYQSIHKRGSDIFTKLEVEKIRWYNDAKQAYIDQLKTKLADAKKALYMEDDYKEKKQQEEQDVEFGLQNKYFKTGPDGKSVYQKQFEETGEIPEGVESLSEWAAITSLDPEKIKKIREAIINNQPVPDFGMEYKETTEKIVIEMRDQAISEDSTFGLPGQGTTEFVEREIKEFENNPPPPGPLPKAVSYDHIKVERKVDPPPLARKKRRYSFDAEGKSLKEHPDYGKSAYLQASLHSNFDKIPDPIGTNYRSGQIGHRYGYKKGGGRRMKNGKPVMSEATLSAKFEKLAKVYNIKYIIKLNGNEYLTLKKQQEVAGKFGIKVIMLQAHEGPGRPSGYKGKWKGSDIISGTGGYSETYKRAFPYLAEGNTLVHCSAGADRAGGLVAAWLKFVNNTAKDYKEKEKLYDYVTLYNGWNRKICCVCDGGDHNNGYAAYMEGFYSVREWCNAPENLINAKHLKNYPGKKRKNCKVCKNIDRYWPVGRKVPK